uniref:Uncharacterized protein n=1 Tax=Seriola dumerili TaxID=41447 RepID=A0A3B4U029_SERDU
MNYFIAKFVNLISECLSVRFVICTNDTFRYRPTLDVTHQSSRKVSSLYSPT